MKLMQKDKKYLLKQGCKNFDFNKIEKIANKINISIGKAEDFLTSTPFFVISYKYKKINLKTARKYISRQDFLNICKLCLSEKFITYEINLVKQLKFEVA